MEEGELSDEDNVSYETVSSGGSVYFGDGPNNVYCNKSKSLDSSSLNLSNKTVGPRPTSCDPNSFPNACISGLSNSSTQSKNRKRCSNKDSQKGNKENYINDIRPTNFTGRLPSMPSSTEPELLESHPHTDRVTLLKRKHSRPERRNSDNVELTEVHSKRRKRRRKKQNRGHSNDSRDQYRNNNSILERKVICNEKQKFRNKHGAKHKKNDGLLRRVISKSGPSQVKEISDPLISGCAESSLMKKLVGSGTLIIKSNSVSSNLKCEIGSTASISSPDMEMFEDMHVTSSDPDSPDDVLIISEDDISYLEQNMSESSSMKSSTVKCPESLPDYSDDSEIEVIIPEKKVPLLVMLDSDGEEEVVTEDKVVTSNENQGNQTLDVNSDINPLSLVSVSNEESVENIISEVEFDKEDITYPDSEKTQTLIIVNNETNDEEDNNILNLRMIALKSSKDRSKLDNNKVSSGTESQSEDNMPYKSVETPLATRPEEDDDVLTLRVMALKSAMLKKHNERVKKGMQVRKGSNKRNEITNDKGRRSSAYSPSNITSPLSPSTSYELSLQGEEDMEIAESDVEGEIVEEVNNLCENDQLKVSGDGWKEPVNVMGHPLVINAWIDGNASVPNEFYPGIPSSQKYSYPLSKHVLEYSQPLPPGVDPVASSSQSLNTFCSSQFKLVPPPPLPPILSLPPPPPPPPPPPLSPQPWDTINNNLQRVNTNRNVTDFVQSGNEFSVHHTVPVFMQNNANLQCSSLNSNFCNTPLQTSENCLDISKSSECNRPIVLTNCISSQGNYEGNVSASYFNNLDSNIDTLCHSQPQELFPKPDQLNNSFLSNLKIGSKQNVKSRPNLLEITINKNIDTDFINTNTMPLKTPTSNIQAELPSNNEIELSNKIGELVRQNDEVSIGNKNILNINREKTVNDKTQTSKKNVSAGRRKKKLRLMKKKAAQLSHVILKDYFRSPLLLENSNIQKEQNEGPSSENDINNLKNKDSNVNDDNIKLNKKDFKQNYEQFCATKKIQQTSNIRNINNFGDNESSILNTPIKFYLTDYFSVLDDKEKVKNNEEECQTDTDKNKSTVEEEEFENLETSMSEAEINKSTVEEEEFENLETSQSEAEILESVNPSCSNEEIVNENANTCTNTGNNEEIDMDLAEMIVLDEVGMSPEHKSKEMDEEIVIENQMKVNDDEDDIDILRAKALTSISTKIFDFSQIPTYTNETTLQNSNNQRMPRESFIDNCFPSNKALAYVNPQNLAENFPPNKVTELGEKSRYRISRVPNNEHVRSVVKGKSLKVVIPSDGPVINKPNISTAAQISPPLVSRLVINVGDDSDTDEDPHNECDEWSRKVTIRDSENKQLDQEGDNISVDVEKSVEILLSNMRRQHENMSYYDNKCIHFDEPIEMLIEKPVPSVTEFNVTGVLPSPRPPVKRLSTTDQTPVQLLPHSKQEEYQRLKQELDHMERLLPHSKQEEYRKLKQELANMEKQRQLNTKKITVSIKPNPTSKPSSSLLKNVRETCKINQKTALKNNLTSEQKLPVEKSTESSRMNLEEISLTQNSEEVEKIDKIGILSTSSRETSNNQEVRRIEPTIQDLDRAEKELLSERYTVIDELTEMNNLLGDFERAQEKLTGHQIEVVRLKKELLAAEEKLQEQKSVILTIQNDFFTTHAKMISGKMSCDQWEKTCSKLGVDLNGTHYVLPNGGKKLLIKKIQHVSERTKKLKIKDRTVPKKTSSNSTQSSDSIDSRKQEKPKEQATVLSKEIVSNDVAESQISETSSQDTLEQMETCSEISTEDPQVLNEAESQNNKTILYEKDLTSKTSEILFSTSDCTLLTERNTNESIDSTISPDKTESLVLTEIDVKHCEEVLFGINRVVDVPETQSDVTCSDVNKTILKDTSDGTQMNPSEKNVTIPSEMKVRGNESLKEGNDPIRPLKSQSKISNYRSPLQHFGIIHMHHKSCSRVVPSYQFKQLLVQGYQRLAMLRVA